ncbi:MAG: hypothetical protein RQ801_04950 [Spirochaetaceae bacterium]|nr:hypothetical protein [Spirochaetaceae bacterium]MDT8297627.1 hypothetical protein [Spirochaetaceae bacterium]
MGIPITILLGISDPLIVDSDSVFPYLERRKRGPVSKVDSELAKVKALPPKQQQIILDMIESVIRNNPQGRKKNRMNIEALHPKYITDETGAKTEVILSMDMFNQLIEDLEDLAVIAERRDEPVTTHEDFLAELKSDGLI